MHPMYVSLDESYHMNDTIIWFWDEDVNGFYYIKPLMN